MNKIKDFVIEYGKLSSFTNEDLEKLLKNIVIEDGVLKIKLNGLTLLSGKIKRALINSGLINLVKQIDIIKSNGTVISYNTAMEQINMHIKAIKEEEKENIGLKMAVKERQDEIKNEPTKKFDRQKALDELLRKVNAMDDKQKSNDDEFSL